MFGPTYPIFGVPHETEQQPLSQGGASHAESLTQGTVIRNRDSAIGRRAMPGYWGNGPSPTASEDEAPNLTICQNHMSILRRHTAKALGGGPGKYEGFENVGLTKRRFRVQILTDKSSVTIYRNLTTESGTANNTSKLTAESLLQHLLGMDCRARTGPHLPSDHARAWTTDQVRRTVQL